MQPYFAKYSIGIRTRVEMVLVHSTNLLAILPQKPVAKLGDQDWVVLIRRGKEFIMFFFWKSHKTIIYLEI